MYYHYTTTHALDELAVFKAVDLGHLTCIWQTVSRLNTRRRRTIVAVACDTSITSGTRALMPSANAKFCFTRPAIWNMNVAFVTLRRKRLIPGGIKGKSWNYILYHFDQSTLYYWEDLGIGARQKRSLLLPPDDFRTLTELTFTPLTRFYIRSGRRPVLANSVSKKHRTVISFSRHALPDIHFRGSPRAQSPRRERRRPTVLTYRYTAYSETQRIGMWWVPP
ncbi:hypothetical protein C8R44DRAFT_738631 [Mycena epipterygia]|nr:hypothetical protein C8R44DRAFT_738631 [Mycena epipterygia]